METTKKIVEIFNVILSKAKCFTCARALSLPINKSLFFLSELRSHCNDDDAPRSSLE